MGNKYDIDFTQFVELDSNSPTGLIWATNRYGGRGHKVLLRSKGDIAGSLLKTSKRAFGSWQLSINNKPYIASRVVWKLKYGSIDSNLLVDHIDGNPLNNSLTNLRLVTYQTNAQNRGLSRNNITGINGVRLAKEVYLNTVYYYWVADWATPLGKYAKRFSVKKYGDCEARKLACEWRNKQIKSLNDSGADYTDRHCITSKLSTVLN